MIYLAKLTENESDEALTEIFSALNIGKFFEYFASDESKPKVVTDIKFLQLIYRIDGGRSRHPLPFCNFNAYDTESPCSERTMD